MIRDVNKVKRLEFATSMLTQNEIFADCVFTDESTVEVFTSSKFCYTRLGKYRARLRARPKHPAKVHIWGGISMRGTTSLAILPGHMRINSATYCRILEKCYLKFHNTIYHGFARLVHDNAPAHTSVFTKKKLDAWKIKVLDWPPESPDLNPIELIWGSMKSFLRRHSIRNLHELKLAIREFWRTLTPQKCKRYVEGIQWRLQEVVKAEGGNIKEKKPASTSRVDPDLPSTSHADPFSPTTSHSPSTSRLDPSSPDTSRDLSF
ncbi:unnamed protein product [Cylicocyclus nassatus]|uniref:Tc1-like transposase DDE domain-containing protein n=1 Tax=Cylicocyclus nassatus TaxID=53992 RepID=A0AA36DLF9_CYLNA|nr:unnamed protein product [Cylicocyclus nassatus]